MHLDPWYFLPDRAGRCRVDAKTRVLRRLGRGPNRDNRKMTIPGQPGEAMGARHAGGRQDHGSDGEPLNRRSSLIADEPQ